MSNHETAQPQVHPGEAFAIEMARLFGRGPLTSKEIQAEMNRTYRVAHCVECGWRNKVGRSCCERCGQEDWGASA